jgi:signal transduction histidine kinase
VRTTLTIWLCILLALSTSAAPSDTLLISDGFREISLTSRIQYAETSTDVGVDSAWQLLTGPVHAEALNKVQLGPVNGFYWLTLTVSNRGLHKKDLYLQVRQAHIYQLAFFRVTSDSIESQFETGIHFPFAQRPVQHRFFTFPIFIEPGESFTVLLMVHHLNSLTLPLWLYDSQRLHESDYAQNMLWGFWSGFLSFCAVFALVAAALLRVRLFVWYFLYILSVTLYGLADQGYAFQFLFPAYADLDAPAIIHLAVYTFIFLIRFSQGLLETKRYLPRTHKALNIVFIFMLVMIVAGILFSGLMFRLSTIVLPAINLVTLAGLILLAYSGIKALRTNRTVAIFYLIAYGALIGASIFSIVTFGFGAIQYAGPNITLASFFLEAMLLSVALVILYKQIQHERTVLTTQISIQKQEMYGQYVDGIERERGRIAGELHEDIGSRLSHMKRNFERTANVNIEEFDQIIADIRSLSHDLALPVDQVSAFMPLAERLIAEARIDSGIDIKLQRFDFEERLTPSQIQQVYRIMQEILHNIVKHSAAHRADIQFFGYEDSLVITAEDDGVGFSTETTKGFGLNQLKLRTAALGATIEISSEPGKGTMIMVEVGYNETSAGKT